MWTKTTANPARNGVFKYSKEGMSSEVKQRLFTWQYYLGNYKCQAITTLTLDISKSQLKSWVKNFPRKYLWLLLCVKIIMGISCTLIINWYTWHCSEEIIQRLLSQSRMKIKTYCLWCSYLLTCYLQGNRFFCWRF